MNENENELLLRAAMNILYNDSTITDRAYFADFRRGWDAAFKRARSLDAGSLPARTDAVFPVRQSFSGIELTLHFDQRKMHEWYAKELQRNSRQIFVPKRFKRANDGSLSFRGTPCRYDGDAEEPALTEEQRNIIACALPALPPEMAVVYGNKWVDGTASALRPHSLPMFWLQTDYVPAFLGSNFEVCMYLFMMDCCIIKENYQKVEDAELRKFLHIFRPSPMLSIRKLV